MSQPPNNAQPMRPRTYDVSIKSILSFPLRICNPPPAVGKVRSCGVTPLFKVRLEDVLDRKHLPPLGLKDFEEWLLYVELSPENLYFTLWLREYRERYNEWIAQTKFQRELGGEFRTNWSTQHSPSLAMFYARAKQTFFTPNSPYELNLPSSLLAVFHTSTESPHPDPAIFTDVAIETYRMLDESLRRFVSAQFNNVGNNRVLCGMIAGVFLALLGSIPPIVLNLTKGDSRWTRLASFPGLFIGLTILTAALNGICLGVYIFGDLRQLRKFELARPSISKPQPVSERETKRHSVASEVATLPNPLPSTNESLQPAYLIATAPSAIDARVANLTQSASISNEDLSVEAGSESDHTHERAAIHISPAFYDDSSDIDVERGIISTNFAFPASVPVDRESSPVDSEYTATAAFIHPFDTNSIDFSDLDNRPDFFPEQRQRVDVFDFDLLPPRQRKLRTDHRISKQYERDCCRNSLEMPSPTSPTFPAPAYPYPIESYPPHSFIERVQSRCDIKKWRLQTESTDRMASPTSSSFTANPYNFHILHKSHRSLSTDASDETKVNKRFKLVRAVPAFAVPLTRVLSPIIRRGQWEIVVRSAAISFVISWIVVGALLAVPVIRR